MESYTCFEKINLQNLTRLLRVETDPQKKTKLLKFQKLATPQGIIKCEYKNKKHVAGRLYAYPSLQGVDKQTRQIISAPSWDFDIVNAYPTILMNLCNAHGIKCDILADYVANRDAWLKTGITKDNIIHSLFGSQEYTTSQRLLDFRCEIARITDRLISVPEYKELARAVKGLKSNAREQSVISYIIQTTQALLIPQTR